MIKMAKLEENKTKTLQIRLTNDDYELLKKSAFILGTTPSKLVRQFIQININAMLQAQKNASIKNENE